MIALICKKSPTKQPFVDGFRRHKKEAITKHLSRPMTMLVSPTDARVGRWPRVSRTIGAIEPGCPRLIIQRRTKIKICDKYCSNFSETKRSLLHLEKTMTRSCTTCIQDTIAQAKLVFRRWVDHDHYTMIVLFVNRRRGWSIFFGVHLSASTTLLLLYKSNGAHHFGVLPDWAGRI